MCSGGDELEEVTDMMTSRLGSQSYLLRWERNNGKWADGLLSTREGTKRRSFDVQGRGDEESLEAPAIRRLILSTSVMYCMHREGADGRTNL